MKLNGVQNNNFDFQCMDKKRQSKAKQNKQKTKMTQKQNKWKQHKGKTLLQLSCFSKLKVFTWFEENEWCL